LAGLTIAENPESTPDGVAENISNLDLNWSVSVIQGNIAQLAIGQIAALSITSR